MKFIRFYLLSISIITALSAVASREAVSLASPNGSVWKMNRAGDTADGADRISAPGFDASAWLDATVPGTVLTNLVNNGAYPDPYYGKNNKLSEGLIPDISKVGRDFYTYWFRTEFDVPADFKGRRIWLSPEGINYRSEIWVNGRLADITAGMFLSRNIDISHLVEPGKKAALAVKVYPVDVPGSTMPKSWGAPGEWHNGGDGWIGLNVTQLMTVGWDFTYEDGVRDRNTGIWRDIKLYTTGEVQLRAPMVRSDVDTVSFARSRETISVEVHNPNTYDTEYTVTARIPEAGVEISKNIRLLRGEHKELVFNPDEFPALAFDNPRLWWPKNKGEQPLYTLSLIAKNKKGELSDSIGTRFGIRHIEAARNTPDSSKLFKINGRPMFVRGTNWIPDAMLRTDDSRMDTELRYTAQSGVNLLRLWGGGIAESDRFYELCDSLGLMVWQEFWMTGDTRHPADETIYLANIESTVKRIRNHPSIIFYVSSNESSEVSGARELLTRLDGTRPYQMQSECDGVHDGSPYKQVNPMCHYENTASERGSRIDGFNPEYGAPTLPIYESLRRMMPETALWPIDKATWDYMDGNGFHLMTTLYDNMVKRYGESENIEQYSRRAQLVGAINSKSIWETWNEHKMQYGDRWTSGLLFWYHNCPNPQVCARMWDYSLQPTASLYHTMHALEPLHVQYNYLTNTVSIVNDGLEAFDGLSVTADIYDFDSHKVSSKTTSASVGADAVANNVLTLDFPENISQIHFISLKLADKSGKKLSDNFYWRSLDRYEGRNTVTGPCTGGFENLAALPTASPSLRVRPIGENRWSVTLRNSKRRIAFFCQLLLTDENDSPVDGAFYTDNFVSLLPGESRTIEIEAPSAPASPLRLKFNEALAPTKTYTIK